MTALTVPAGTTVPSPRAAVGHIPAPRRSADHVPSVPAPRPASEPTTPVTRPASRPGRHRAAVGARSRATRPSDLVTLAARAGSVVTLAAMLVAAAAAAGLTDGVAPTGDAARVATATLR